MYIDDVVGLNGVDLRISFFNTAIAQVVDQLPATGVQIQPLNTFLQPDFVVRNTANNTAGTIRYAATQAFPNCRLTALALWRASPFKDCSRNLHHHLGHCRARRRERRAYAGDHATLRYHLHLIDGCHPGQLRGHASLDHVLVAWETISETDNAGFNLYRAESASGPQTLLAYVPAQAPGSTQGFAYTYDDLPVQPGQTYWYWLEDVSLNGATELHGPVSVTIERAGGGHAGLAAGHAGRAGGLAGACRDRGIGSPGRRSGEHTAAVRLAYTRPMSLS